MTDPTHKTDAEIDRALGKDWPAKDDFGGKIFRSSQEADEYASKLEHTENLLFSARETIKRLEAELTDRKNLDPVRHCFSRQDAEKLAEAWLVEGCPNIPMAGVVLMAFIRDTFPVAREAGKIWETKQ